MRRIPIIATLAVASLLIAACGSKDESKNTPAPAPSGSSSPAAPDAANPAASASGSQSTAPAGDSKGAGGKVGVYTWWADGSEKKGLDELQKIFKEKFPNDEFENLAVAGGAGSNAKDKLASDLQNGNPPDTFQGHAGAELLDYIKAGQIEPVNDIIDTLGGDKVFPSDLLKLLTHDGKIYSVPSNIHRANVVWVNNEVLTKAGIDPKTAPKDMDAWLADMEKIKAAGVQTPLSIAGTWTQTQLFESVLISALGPDAYTGLFNGSTKWDDAKVVTAIENYAKLLTFANTPADGSDWPEATDMVIEGKAAYNVMGDWAVAQFTDKGKKDGTDYSYWAVPGQDGVYDFLADSFTMPKGAKNPAGAKDWLMTIGSAEGQKAFNLAKGSIPARTDVAVDDFPPYQQWAMKSFKSDKIVSSIAHGAAVSVAWGKDINAAMAKFMATKDQGALKTDLVKAAEMALEG